MSYSSHPLLPTFERVVTVVAESHSSKGDDMSEQPGNPGNNAPQRDELPLPDFDHVPLGTLPMRIAPLDEGGVTQLFHYEQAHGNRLPVIVVLESRIEQLRNGAEPSGSIAEDMPEMNSTQHGSPVSPATAGPQVTPPATSGPMLPDQPAR